MFIIKRPVIPNERVGSVLIVRTPDGIEKYRVVKKSALQIIIAPGEKNEEIIPVKLIKSRTWNKKKA